MHVPADGLVPGNCSQSDSQGQRPFLSLVRSKLRLCAGNHMQCYWSNLTCDWLSIVWTYSKQETENRAWGLVQYRKSNCGDKTILRPSYLHNGISYTGKTPSCHWIRAHGLVSIQDLHSTELNINKIVIRLTACRPGWWRQHYDLDVWHIEGLVQERRNSSALAMEFRLSCTNPSIWFNHTS